MKRSAPKNGYCNDRKNMYRREVWNTFRRYAPRAGAVVLLPSIEGLEIELAKSKGFNTGDMHVIDQNPAIVAHIKRRYPKVTTYGVSAGKAFAERMASAKVRVRCANLDFTGPVTVARLRELQQVAESGVLMDGACVGVTVLRGRESKDGFKHLSLSARIAERGCRGADYSRYFRHAADVQALTLTDIDRIRVMKETLHADEIIRAGVYTSSNGLHTMLWAVYEVSALKEDVVPAYRALLEQTVAYMEGVRNDAEINARIELVAPGFLASAGLV